MQAVSTIRYLPLALASALLAGCGGDALYVVPTELVTDGDVDFGTAWVEEPVERTVILTAPRGAISVTSISAGNATLNVDWDGAPLAIDDDEVELSVTWTPTVPGPLNATITFISDAIANPTETIAATGLAETPPTCESNPPCIVAAWDPIAEVCVIDYPIVPCEDGNICTIDDTCIQGYCDPGRWDNAADPSCSSTTCTPGATVIDDPFANRWVEEIWSDGPNNIWFAGADGVVIRWDGQNWSVIETCTEEDLYSIWGTPAGDIWAAGRAGTVLHWDGDAWTSETPPTDVRLWGIWADDAGVWAVGDDGVALARDASGWEAHDPGTDEILYSVWGTDPDLIWAVGDLGVIVHWNGTTWETQQSFVGEELYAVRGLAADHVIAVGGAGAMVQYDGADWHEVNSQTAETLFAVALVHTGELWVSGHLGVMRHHHYGTWDDHTNGLGANMYALWANASDDVWLGGSAGKVWRWGGSDLEAQP